jgi:hypothetical protein
MSAAACALLLHLASLHGSAGFSGDTPGIGLECESGAYIVGAGQFKNSLGEPSRYAVGGLTLGGVGPLKLGALAGVIDGYKPGGRWQPVAAGLVSVNMGHGLGLRVLAIPRVSGVSPATLHVALSVGF